MPEVAELVADGKNRDLRDRDSALDKQRQPRLRLLVIGLDGINRDLLYDMLAEGRLPGLASLLGGQRGRRLPHAHLDRDVVAMLPSLTLPGWAATFTGEPPAVNGIPGNEFFIPDRHTFATFAPISFTDPSATIEMYTDDTVGKMLLVPTIYERIRERDPGVMIWVSMSQFHRGADRLLLAKREVILAAGRAYVAHATGIDGKGRELSASMDAAALDTVIEAIDDQVPDLLTVYVGGIDLYTHHAKEGPDRARRAYLREVVDPKLVELRSALDRHQALDDAYVVVTSDHGHSRVAADEHHALDDQTRGDPARVFESAGFRLRPRKPDVSKDDDFQAVIAYAGPLAMVYVADRSRCPRRGQRCDFASAARFDDDVVPLAEAFWRSSRDGQPVPGLEGTLELVLVRRSSGRDRAQAEFQVYLGRGRVQSVDGYLASRPGLDAVALEPRLRDLTRGPAGDRAGDLILVARSSLARSARDRYYFSKPYHSQHGSASREDSEVPLILAHRGKSSAQLRRIADRHVSAGARLPAVGRLLISLGTPDRLAARSRSSH